ncbi:hypothetical protein Tco_0645776 [Tanacetum coccineum]
MSIRPQAPAPFLSEEVAERLLALPTPPHTVLSYTHHHFLRYPLYHYLYHHHHPIALHMLRDLWDPELLGLDKEMHYHLLSLEMRCLRCVYHLHAALGRQTSRELGYGITDTWDDLVGAIQEIAPTTLEGVNQRVTELATTVDQEDEIIYSQLDDARHDRALLRARVNMLYKDRPFHRRTALLMEEEARVSRAAWAQSMDACDQATDRRRQMVISDLLKADHRRQRQLVEALKIVKSLKTQMIELQRQQGPAKDPAEPELPEEASSSS